MTAEHSPDTLSSWVEPHEPVNVTEAMREASEPTPERITRPANAGQVDRIAKSESRPTED
jgi:hypothetical protein